MKSRRATSSAFQAEQMQQIASGNPIRTQDIINQSPGTPPPRLTALLSRLPGRLPGQLLNLLTSKSRRNSYLLTQSALIMQRHNGQSRYYEVYNLRRAEGNKANGMVSMLTKSGAELQIGPMERPALFADAINRTIVGAPNRPTCGQCQHYQRHPDQNRGNAGSCQYQQLVLGNHDRCRQISLKKGYNP